MRRIQVVMAVGVCVAAAGFLFALKAGVLATQWQPTGNGGWGGVTDPALRQTLAVVGIVLLGSGLLAVAAAGWSWLMGDPHRRPHRPQV